MEFHFAVSASNWNFVSAGADIAADDQGTDAYSAAN